MRKLDLKIDVTAACRTEERIDCAVTVIAPEPAEIRSAPVVMFGWPGGGYNRSYFDLHVAGAEGYSQAEFHAGAGVIFVACDHVAVGDSTVPNAGLDHPDIARANRAVVAALVEELRNGALLEGLGPVEPAAVIGMGQSYGGLLLTLAEANEPIFDGVAMLGWSGINTTPPAPMVGCPGWNELAANGATHPYRRAFHYDDVPEASSSRISADTRCGRLASRSRHGARGGCQAVRTRRSRRRRWSALASSRRKPRRSPARCSSQTASATSAPIRGWSRPPIAARPTSPPSSFARLPHA